MGLKKFMLPISLLISVMGLISTEENTDSKEVQVQDAGQFIGRMIEEGRTMVHHAVKRFMIILPAIFFKLGIAFTMLVLVAIASVTNGFIGFLLLVVGLSSVLARLQESSRKPAVVPYYLPAYHSHASVHHGWDRSDKEVEKTERTQAQTQAYPSYSQQYLNNPLSTYNPAYYGQKNL